MRILVPAVQFLRIVDALSPTLLDDVDRPHLCVYHVNATGKAVEFVTTDSHRLSHWRETGIRLLDDGDPVRVVDLLPSTVDQIVAAAKAANVGKSPRRGVAPAEYVVDIDLATGSMALAIGTVEDGIARVVADVRAVRASGKFPDYWHVMPRRRTGPVGHWSVPLDPAYVADAGHAFARASGRKGPHRGPMMICWGESQLDPVVFRMARVPELTIVVMPARPETDTIEPPAWAFTDHSGGESTVERRDLRALELDAVPFVDTVQVRARLRERGERMVVADLTVAEVNELVDSLTHAAQQADAIKAAE